MYTIIMFCITKHNFFNNTLFSNILSAFSKRQNKEKKNQRRCLHEESTCHFYGSQENESVGHSTTTLLLQTIQSAGIEPVRYYFYLVCDLLIIHEKIHLSLSNIRDLGQNLRPLEYFQASSFARGVLYKLLGGYVPLGL